jgi:sarcosine/dimethylglycine N-methyltransferase
MSGQESRIERAGHPSAIPVRGPAAPAHHQLVELGRDGERACLTACRRYGDALDLPFADGSFDLSWTQAVAQNVADKRRLIAELTRAVAPGGRVAMFEIVAGPGAPSEFPVPWADRADQSWLVPADHLRRLIEGGPLEVVHWLHAQAALEAMGAAEASVLPPGSDRGVGLHLLMPDHEARMATMLRNVAQQRVELVLAVARRTL